MSLDTLLDGVQRLMDNGFPERLRQLRKQKNLSQGELAKLVSVHYNHIGRYERGSSRPSADALQRLASALGVSADYLIEGSTEDAARASFADRDLLRIFQEVEKLDAIDKDVVKRLLDAFLMKKQLQELAAR
jgi:transcriptional regulator with XRE-family HTH domain